MQKAPIQMDLYQERHVIFGLYIGLHALEPKHEQLPFCQNMNSFPFGAVLFYREDGYPGLSITICISIRRLI